MKDQTRKDTPIDKRSLYYFDYDVGLNNDESRDSSSLSQSLAPIKKKLEQQYI